MVCVDCWETSHVQVILLRGMDYLETSYVQVILLQCVDYWETSDVQVILLQCMDYWENISVCKSYCYSVWTIGKIYLCASHTVTVYGLLGN